MNKLRFIVPLLMLCMLAVNSHARIDAYPFDDPVKEQRYKKMIKELRCLVCQNQDLADSNAELALDLRRKTYNMVVEGQSDEQIIDYMTERYGDFVLYRPPLRSTTVFLWAGPFLILALGLYFLIRVIRSRRKNPHTELADADRAKAEDLLKSD